MNTGDTTADDILSTLQQTKTTRTKLTMIVFGQGERAGKIYDEAMQVAQNYASLAQIVRVPDPSVLQHGFQVGAGYDLQVETSYWFIGLGIQRLTNFGISLPTEGG